MKAEKLAKKLLPAGVFEQNKQKKRCKIVVFLPVERSDEMIFALASAGAGTIGKYTLCSFRAPGIGTFMGGKGSEPVIGQEGKFEMAEEVRLEMICDKKDIDKVVRKMYEVHPYDEPAYEVYNVMTGTKNMNADYAELTLKEKIAVRSLLKKINPKILASNIPQNMKDTKVERCIIDCKGDDDTEPAPMDGKTIYIRKNKKNIKAYLI